jgi:trehalose 6-phosphate phosphatase
MTALTDADRLTTFFDQLRSASTRILLLDYDGTLAPFQIQRDRALPYPEVSPLLGRIMRSGTRVVLISGRPAREVVLLSGIHPHPEIWGSHGLEHLQTDGSYHVGPLSPEQEAGLLQAAEYLRSQGLEDRMELKPSGVALHWRGMPDSQSQVLRGRVQQCWARLAGRYSLELLDFDGGLEIKVKGRDKGKAVAAIIKDCDSQAVIAYLGDDRTDEDAFRALKGRGLTILVREQSRPTLADRQLRPPRELIHFLQAWLAASGEEV